MPYRIVIQLFDRDKAIENRKNAGARISCIADPLSLDTATGLPAELDLRIRESTFELPELFSDWITVDERIPSSDKALNPAADLFIPSAASPTPYRPVRLPPVVIAPIFSPLRRLDYRFSKISIDWRDFTMNPSDASAYSSAGSVEVGFGVIHLYRDKSEVYRSDLPLPEPASSDAAMIEGNGCLLAVLSIPSVMTVSDFLLFIEPATEYIRQLRILRDEGMNRCMALIRFRGIDEAEQFLEEFNGRPFFAMLDDELCQVVRVAQVEVRISTTPPFTFPLGSELAAPAPPVNAVELPTCVVCLERMDANITGLITIPCQHTFHCTCLSKWASGRCPVCRYTQSKIKPLNNTAGEPVPPASCEQCGAESRLWMCLICGHVGCGRYAGRHAIHHFDQLGHQYAMELESQRVWDYAGDSYVHRLIQNRPDGRLVELPSTLNHETNDEKRKHSSSLGPDMTDNITQSKVERMSEEFAHLLATQLEAQRNYYFDKIKDLKKMSAVEQDKLKEQIRSLQTARRDQEAREVSMQVESSRMAEERSETQKRLKELESIKIPELERERNRTIAKLEKTAERSRSTQQDLDIEKQVTRNLKERVNHSMSSVDQLKAENAHMKSEARPSRSFLSYLLDVQKQVEGLKEQIDDLLANLSFRDQIAADPEMAGMDLGVRSALPPKPISGAKKKKKPKKPPPLVTNSIQKDSEIATEEPHQDTGEA